MNPLIPWLERERAQAVQAAAPYPVDSPEFSYHMGQANAYRVALAHCTRLHGGRIAPATSPRNRDFDPYPRW